MEAEAPASVSFEDRREWRFDKEDLGRFIAPEPEGQEDSAQGFQPWEPPTRATRPERAPDQT